MTATLKERLESYERAKNIANNLDTAIGHVGVAIQHLNLALADAKVDYQYNDQDIINMIGALRLVQGPLIHEQDEWSGYAARRKDVL